MSKTQGRWEQQTPFTDGQIFVGASNWQPLASASAALASAGAGLFTWNGVASSTINLFSSLTTLLRTGQLATVGVNQEQFGTAALAPGPSAVANTTDPLALPPGFPPWTNAVNPAITGGYRGPIPKGLQINYVDPVYEVDTLALTSATFGLTQTKMPVAGTPAAPIVTNIIPLAANGLTTAVNTAGQATRTRITPASPAFVILDGSEIVANINFVTPATSTLKFYGAVLGVTFNYN